MTSSGPSAGRLSRRTLLGGAAASGALALLPLGCSDDDDAGPGDNGDPVAGGTLRTGTTLPLSSGLDPHAEAGTGLAVFPRLYGYLLHVDPRDDSLILDQAESVEQPDAVTIIARLRGDVRFHDIAPVDGRRVTAADVVSSVERYRDNPLVVTKTWHTTVLDRIQARDGRTVVVTTKRPYVYSLYELGCIAGGAILPVEMVDADADISRTAIGSGPFRVEAPSTPEDIRIVRNPAYFGAPLPYLGAMRWLVYPDEEKKVAAFEARGIDVVVHRDRAESRRTRDFSEDIDTATEPGLGYLSLGLRTDRAPFTDERVREAIDLAVDRKALIDQVLGGDGVPLGPVNPHIADSFWALPAGDVVQASRSDERADDRRSEARAMLDAAAAAGATVRIQTPDVPEVLDVAALVRDQLREVGLAAELQPLPQLEWFVNFRRGDFDATLISQVPYETPDLPVRLYHSQGVDGTGSNFGFAGPQIDALVERSWAEADREGRRATLLEAQRLMLRARPMLQLFTGRGYTSAWDYVRGRRPELTGSLAQFNYGQWIAEDGRQAL